VRFAFRRAMLALVLLNLAIVEQAVTADQSTLRSAGGGRQSIAEFSDGHTLVVFAHQDDDLLWMMPFWPVTARFLLAAYPAAPVFEDLIKSFPARLKYRARWTPIWNSVDNDSWAEIFTDRCKRAPIVNLAALKAHLRPFFAPPIKRVVTHNNWGEYGHAQHRLVNIAVRQLAVETGLDVWALGMRMPNEAQVQSQYVNVAGELGLPTIEGYFDPKLFREVRAAYLARVSKRYEIAHEYHDSCIGFRMVPSVS
jgi:hypothetical protein